MSDTSGDTSAAWNAFNRRIQDAAGKIRGASAGANGGSLRERVWQQDKVVLYRYLPLPFVPCADTAPVLICYALVNRPSVLDLQPDRSFVQGLLASGLDVYLIDWGYPDAGDRELALSHYIEIYLAGCVDYVNRTHSTPALNLLGVCQGGTLSLCYSASHPERVANLVLLGTPVDFHTPENLLSRWARHIDTDLLARTGNLSGALLTSVFLALSPFRLMHQKYVALLDQIADPGAVQLFGRMERWIFDSPDQPAAAACQFVRWFYQENRFVRGGLEIGAHEIDLTKVRQPVLNIYAKRDHIVPPSATTALRERTRSRDYSELGIDTGHIGLYVSSRSGTSLPRRVSNWLKQRSGALEVRVASDSP